MIAYWKPMWEYRWERYDPKSVKMCHGFHPSIPGAYCLTCEKEIN